ncbi:MAG: ABC transporter substrate-binding protein [Burkholderiales bacterium]
MNRRDSIIRLFALGAAGNPLSSLAQTQTRVWRIGRLNHTRRPESPESHWTGAFPIGMRELGYIEGKNLITEEHYSDGDPERLLAQMAGLMRLKLDLIVTGSTPATRAAQKATGTIPIVFCVDTDPVVNQFVASLAHPGGNITGLSIMGVDFSTKHLEMLRSMAPKVSRVAVLMNPSEGPVITSILNSIQAAGKKIGVTILPYYAQVSQEIDGAFAQMVRQRAEGLIVVRGPFLNNQSRLIAELAAKHRLPAIAGLSEYVTSGGLISYGPNLTDMFRRAATYVDKIFKGAKPADLPVEQPTTFELFINRKAAKTLGLTIPPSLLISVDKIIE